MEEIIEVNQRLKYRLFPNCFETTVFGVMCTAERCKTLCKSETESPSDGREFLM